MCNLMKGANFETSVKFWWLETVWQQNTDTLKTAYKSENVKYSFQTDMLKQIQN
jgi:hypothetical protein